MPKSIILDIFNGEYDGVAMPPPKTKSYKTNISNSSNYYSELLKVLNADEKLLLQNYIDARGRADSELHDQYFKEGFSLAVRIFIDAIGSHLEFEIDDEKQE